MKTHRRRQSLHGYQKQTFIIVSIIFLVVILLRLLPIVPLDIPASTRVYDTNGELLGEWTKDATYRHIAMTYDDIPPFLLDTIIGMEDQRFWSHPGVDLVGFARSMYHNLQAGRIVQGGSTIPMQIVRNSYWLNSSRTVTKKLAEAIGALALVQQYTKKELITSYVNMLSFGYLNYGFESASQFYFQKSLNQLTQAEQLALFVIAKNATMYNPITQQNTFRERFETLAQTLVQQGKISETEYTHITNETLVFSQQDKPNPATAYAVDYAKILSTTNNIDQPELKLSIDKYMSQQIYNIGYQTILDLQRKNVGDMGIVIVDKKTQEIRVMIGGVDYQGTGGQVNTTTSPNQAGSTLKPFTYALAFKELGYTPQDTILDAPVQFQTSLGFGYAPKNFSLGYAGEVTLANALAQSLNIPAIKIIQELGVEKTLEFYKNLGLTTLDKSADYYGLALTLGVGEVRLIDLVRAYGIFAYGGKVCPLFMFENQSQQSPCTQVIDEHYTNMVGDILSNRLYKLGGFPINSNLDFSDRFVILKSGTSRNFSDNRVVGVTENYIIGVRVGNKDGSNMKGVSGASGAGDIFKSIVYYLEKDDYNPQKPIPDTVSRQHLSITSPLPYSVYTIDTFTPLSAQQISLKFSTNIPYENIQRRIYKTSGSTKKMVYEQSGPQDKQFLWTITPGTYTSELTITSGTKTETQSVDFIVQ